jgi:hypothetical protein
MKQIAFLGFRAFSEVMCSKTSEIQLSFCLLPPVVNRSPQNIINICDNERYDFFRLIMMMMMTDEERERRSK